jgi:serine/threonine protein kinase
MSDVHPRFLFTLLDKNYFETVDNYKAGDELVSVARARLDPSWDIKKAGFWTHVTPPTYKVQAQGWKLHISGNRVTSELLLERLVPIFADEMVAFKFCSDQRMVELSTNKGWSRAAAGKFITVYPTDEHQFIELADKCHAKTKDLRGPYILSDRPYRDSHVVFYRYGGHVSPIRISSHGLRVPYLLGPDGAELPDDRFPYFRLPSWVKDPFPSNVDKGRGLSVIWLNNNRYRVTDALRYSSHGGIYRAEDVKTGKQVIIREARPFLSDSSDPAEAQQLLHKEARILQKLSHTNLVPGFIDLFQEWEHLFLVEERVEGDTLWGHMMNASFGDTRQSTPGQFLHEIRRTIRLLAEGSQEIHDNRVILRDMTKTNVLLLPDGSLKFIDLEFAVDLDCPTPPVRGWTPGYASPGQLAGDEPSFDDDHYALGALIVDMIDVTASGLALNRDGVLGAFTSGLRDLGLPESISDIARGLLAQAPSQRWTPKRVLEAIDAPASSITMVPTDPLFISPEAMPEFPRLSEMDRGDIDSTIAGITKHLHSTMDPSRNDRLWPASAELFETNPVSLRFGASGILHYLWRATGKIPADAVNWILERARPQFCPHGLYIGLSGVAWCLLDIGRAEEAKSILATAGKSDQLFELPGLHKGIAGWGLANLLLWHRTAVREGLNNALNAGQYLIEHLRTDSDGCFWESDGEVPFGLGAGASGIALFFLYLNAAQASSMFIETAIKAAEFDIRNAEWIGPRVYHYPYKGASISAPKSPHMTHGSSGVGSVALRVYSVTGEKRFRQFAEAAAYTISTRSTNKLWQDYGLAGSGEYLIDMYRILHDERYLHLAGYLARAILHYRMFTPDGIAFAGSDMLKVCCDFGMGSSGIGVFLHRLVHPTVPRFLFPDELLAGANECSKPLTETSSEGVLA